MIESILTTLAFIVIMSILFGFSLFVIVWLWIKQIDELSNELNNKQDGGTN